MIYDISIEHYSLPTAAQINRCDDIKVQATEVKPRLFYSKQRITE